MELVKAEQYNVARVMELINQAKEFLKGNGVDQWQQGYPDQACIEQDIRSGIGYLCVRDEETVGYLCIDFNKEPAYDGLEGRWLSEQPYMVIHRMALDGAVRGQGLADRIFELAQELGESRGIHSIKIDTDKDNEIMKHLLQKNGFQFCGNVIFQNSEKIAFEKLI